MGFVYLIRGGDHYKIGITKNIETRLAELQTASPKRLECVGLYEIEDARRVERMLHEQFSTKRLNGEWFDLNALKRIEFEDRIIAEGATILRSAKGARDMTKSQLEVLEQKRRVAYIVEHGFTPKMKRVYILYGILNLLSFLFILAISVVAVLVGWFIIHFIVGFETWRAVLVSMLFLIAGFSLGGTINYVRLYLAQRRGEVVENHSKPLHWVEIFYGLFM